MAFTSLPATPDPMRPSRTLVPSARVENTVFSLCDGQARFAVHFYVDDASAAELGQPIKVVHHATGQGGLRSLREILLSRPEALAAFVTLDAVIHEELATLPEYKDGTIVTLPIPWLAP